MTLDLETIETRYEILDEPNASEILRMEPEQRCFVVHACRDIPALVAEIERLRDVMGERRYYTAETTEAIVTARDELRAEVERLQSLITPTMQIRSGKVVELEAEVERLREELEAAYSNRRIVQRNLVAVGDRAKELHGKFFESKQRVECLVAEAKRLHEELGQATTQEATFVEFLSRVTWLPGGEDAYPSYCDGWDYRCVFCGLDEREIEAEGHSEKCAWLEARVLIKNVSFAAAMFLDRLAKGETEVERLRMILKQDGAAYLPCWNCHKNVATPTLESIQLCFDCWYKIEVEIEQLRAELAAVDSALGEFYCPVLDLETDEPCGSLYKDHSVHLAMQEIERLRASLKAILEEAESDHDRDIIVTECQSALRGVFDGNTEEEPVEDH